MIANGPNAIVSNVLNVDFRENVRTPLNVPHNELDGLNVLWIGTEVVLRRRCQQMCARFITDG